MTRPIDAGTVTRQPWTVRVAGWSARHRWPVFGLWFVLTIGLFVASLAMGGTRTADAVDEDAVRGVDLRGGPSLRRVRVVRASRTRPIGRLLVVGTAAGTIDDPSTAAALDDVLARMAAHTTTIDGTAEPTFAEIVDPRLAPAEAGLVSPDRSTVRIAAAVPGEGAEVDQKLANMRSFLDDDPGGAPRPPDPLARRIARQRGHPGIGQRRVSTPRCG